MTPVPARGLRPSTLDLRRYSRLAFAGLALLIIPFGTATAQSIPSLPAAVAKLVDRPPFDRGIWGIVLRDQNGRILYGRNADKLFIPASNTKLLATVTASALLGADFTVKTSVYPGGPVSDGVLHGDLVLYGRGDPTFSQRCYATDTTLAGVCDTDPLIRFRALADSLLAHGIHVITGDLVGDGSYFPGPLVNGDWSVYDLNWWYAAPVAALGFNDNSINITHGPASTAGAPTLISFWPDFGNISLENRSVTSPAATRQTIDFFREPGTDHLWAEGEIPLEGPQRTEYFAVSDPNLFAARAFRAALAERGIAVLGTTRSTLDSTLYQAARAEPPLGETVSRPLKDWIFPILNTSQNWFAEMTLKQLGRQFGTGGTWDGGLAVERRFLIDSVGIDSTQFAVVDGSGLAASDLVTPAAFTALLRYVREHPAAWNTFSPGLPQSGNTGSLKHRFVGTPLEGRVRAKTGSISRVNTLSGYVDLPGGRYLTFSVQANHQTLPGRVILAQIDSIVVAMARGRK